MSKTEYDPEKTTEINMFKGNTTGSFGESSATVFRVLCGTSNI